MRAEATDSGNSKHTNIRLPMALRLRLEEAAKRERRTMSSMGIVVIERGLDLLEAAGAGLVSAEADTGAAL